ncbi:MAG: hypothetical protein ABIJ86_08230 [Spirochaetota bacterium]
MKYSIGFRASITRKTVSGKVRMEQALVKGLGLQGESEAKSDCVAG